MTSRSILATVLLTVALLTFGSHALACTSLLVTKGASVDG